MIEIHAFISCFRYSPCRKPAASLLQAVYSNNTHLALGGPTDMMTLYSNGAFGAGWQSWSYGGDFNTNSTTDSFPGHQFSFAAALNAQGGYSLSSSTDISSSPFSMLEFNLICSNTSSDIAVQICTCQDCGACGLVTQSVNEFFTPSLNCTLPTSWAVSLVAMPLASLYASNLPLRIINIINFGSDTVSCLLDNVFLS